ncbi:MAG TPA: hypothetical protein VEQ59_08650 [Polyangiaceae bacterium]|nr:hypothetical protein [Polyangiaceae bacterium]
MTEQKDPRNCDCEACRRDGVHEPSCAVHHEPPEPCTCGRTDQAQGAS